MFNRLFAGLCLLALAGPAMAQESAEPATTESVEAPAVDAGEKILVVGQRPGPGMWKVSKGDHVMWVFAFYSPLPVKMEWRSHEVESILSQTQEFISPPSAVPDISKLRMVTLIPFAFGATRLPDDKKLAEVLPPDLYARWTPLKNKYLGDDDDIERERPIFAADRLYWAALKGAGLGNGRDVRERINQLVKKNRIKVTDPGIRMAVDSPVSAIREFKKATLDDSDCFAKTLEQLETDIDSMKVRANAWAKGDLEVIRKLTFPDRAGACGNAIVSSGALKKQPGFQNVDARMKEAWLAAAEKSIGANKTTFAVLPMRQALDPKGYLAELRTRGYTVEDPE